MLLGIKVKTVLEPKKNISILWRRPEPKQTIYRPMKFLLKKQVKDGLILYNIVTSEMILLDENEKSQFECLPAVYNPKMNDLIDRHFIVEESLDENKSVRELRALINKIEPSKRVTGFTVLPTTECNARCYYCFESDHKRCTLTAEMIPTLVNYIALKCKSEPIDITWFGGEPLVANKRISEICDGLKRKEVKFKSSMVSNGYLFDKELIQVAKTLWNLSSVQITIDGTEKEYNLTKSYINPKDNPYKRVLKNIEDLLENGISVNVRFNVTQRNALDLNSLIDELSERFGGTKGFSCYTHAIYEGVGFEPLHYNEATRDYIDLQTIQLDKKLREKKLLGNLAELPRLRTIHCMADNDSTRLIYPDGIVGKCENKSSLDGIGNINDDIVDKEKDRWYKVSEEKSECCNCCLYPNCINLVVCPETGKCTSIRREWREERYLELLESIYEKYSLDKISST